MLNANEPVWSSRPRHRSQAPPSLPWLGLTCGHAFKESRGWGGLGYLQPGSSFASPSRGSWMCPRCYLLSDRETTRIQPIVTHAGHSLRQTLNSV